MGIGAGVGMDIGVGAGIGICIGIGMGVDLQAAEDKYAEAVWLDRWFTG